MSRTPLLFLFPALFACGAPDSSPAQEAATEARAPRPPPVHRGDDTPPPLTIAWVDEPAAPRARASLGLTVRSLSAETLTARIALSTLDADDREIIEELASVTLAPGASQQLSVDTSRLPLQSTTHSAQLVAIARFPHDGDTMVVQSNVVAYHFEAGFRRALVYSLDEMAQALDGGVVQRGRPAEARVRERDGFRSVTPTAESQVTFVRPDGAFASTGAGLIDTGVSYNIDPYYCQNNPWNCCSGANCVDVCVDWRTSFVDASANYEDYGVSVSGSAYQSVDASYAHFTVESCGSAFCARSERVVAEGYLGPDGCALVNLSAGTVHRVGVFTEHRRQGVNATVNYYPDNAYASFAGITRLTKTFTPQSKTVQSVYNQTLGYHASANAAAVVSRALTIAKPGAHIVVQAGVGCNGGAAVGGIPAYDACAGGNTLETGPAQKPDGSPGNLRWKFVIAHEIGHVYQATNNATPNGGGYCFSSGYGWEPGCNGYVDPSEAQSPLCRCDHVTSSNKLHCLQSLERDSAAQIEGFAQFFSARVWNDPSGNDCHFNYYKQFNAFLLFGTAIVQPPVHIDCRERVQWRDTFCFAQGKSTEYDWLNFLWNVNTVGSSTSSLNDLFAIWGIANQTSTSVTWTQLASAASTYYGASSAKYAKFIADGDKFGVDNDAF